MKIITVFALTVAFASLVASRTDENSISEEQNETDQVEGTIESFEGNLKNLLNAVTQQMMPHVIRIVFSSKASLRCLFDFSTVYYSTQKLAPWAVKMVDASGKPSAGLLEGTSAALGDFDECLNVLSPGRRAITGQYCLLEIKPPGPVVQAMKDFQVHKHQNNSTLAHTKSFMGFLRKVRTNPDQVMFRLGACLPSSCSVQGIQSLIDLSTEDFDLPIEVKHCVHKSDVEFRLHHIMILTLFSIVVAVVILCTVVTIFRNNKTSPQSTNSKPENSDSEREKEDISAADFWSKLSLKNNIEKFLTCSSEGDALDVIRGVKVLTVIFAIFTHTYALPHPLHMYRFRDSLNFVKFIDEFTFASVANSSVGIDTFFFLGGFYFVYNRWRLFNRPRSLLYIAKFIALMYLRMIFLQVLVGSIFFLLPVFGSGPLWQEFVEEPLDNCKKHWWMNLLFIQNNLGPYDICLYPTWILATMMQIFLLTTAIVYVMSRWPLYGVICNVAIITVSMFAVAAVTAIVGYPATFTVYFYDYRTSIQMWKYLYTQFYTHMGPQCIGMLTAYLLAEYPNKKFDKIASLLMWIASMVTMVSVVYGLYGYRNGDEMGRGLAVFYATFHRQVWAIAIGWIVYACATGHGGIVNSVLSWNVLVPLEKLCYLAYLLHVLVMYYQGGTQRERIYMGHFNQLMSFIAYTVSSFVLALVCYLFFQAPYEAIEGYIFKRCGGNVWADKSVTDSQITLKNRETIKVETAAEDNSKVLYNRTETDKF